MSLVGTFELTTKSICRDKIAVEVTLIDYTIFLHENKVYDDVDNPAVALTRKVENNQAEVEGSKCHRY